MTRGIFYIIRVFLHLSSPSSPSVTKVALWRIRLRDFEFRCKLRPNRSSIAVRRTMIIWIAFDEISHDSGNGWLESGTAVRFCTSSRPSAPNVHRLFATMHNLGFDGKHGRVCYVIVFFHFWRYARYFYPGLKCCLFFFFARDRSRSGQYASM